VATTRDSGDAELSAFFFTGKLRALQLELAKHELPIAKTILDPLWSQHAQRFEKKHMRRHSWELTPEALVTDLKKTRDRLHDATCASDTNADRVTLATIARLRLMALREGHRERYWQMRVPEVESLLREIRSLIWDRIDTWDQSRARSELLETRKKARQRLRTLGKILSGDARGQKARLGSKREARRAATDTYGILLTYYGRLFQITRAEELLSTWARPMDPIQKVALVAKAVGMPLETLEMHVRVDKLSGRPHASRKDALERVSAFKWSTTAKETARFWAANQLGIKQQRISNLLSSTRMRQKYSPK